MDNDHDVAEVVQAILGDEGYAVSCLYELGDDALPRAVGRIEPDVVLLDGTSAVDYEGGWALAAALRRRHRQVPVVMFTAHTAAVEEAEALASDRSVEADFAGIIRKPFHIDELLEVVAAAARHSAPFDRSRAGETARTNALGQALKARRATDVRPSQMREWALFRDRKGRLVQLYWWQSRGVYQVGRYNDEGVMSMLGQFIDRDAAIDLVLPA